MLHSIGTKTLMGILLALLLLIGAAYVVADWKPATELAAQPAAVAAASSANVSSSCTQASDLGMVGDGVTANDAQFDAWTSSLKASGSCLELGPGKFRFNAPHTIVMPNPAVGSQNTNAVAAVTIKGQGADTTTLYWPGTAGIIVNYSSQQHAIHFSDFAITTGAENDGNAITLTNSYGFFGTFVAQSDITNVTCRGDDGYANRRYWSSCVSISGVSDVNFSNDDFYGMSSGTRGTGISINNPGAGCFASPATCGTVYNIVNSNFSFLGVGIRYGTNTQTVQISNSFFGQNSTAIYVPPDGTTLQGLAVNNSTFFTGAAGDAIYIASDLPNFVATGNLFDVHDGYRGIAMDIANNTTIMGNQFVPDGVPNGATAGIDIKASTPGSIAVIDGNTFSSVKIGIRLQSASTGVTVGPSNVYTGNTTNVSNSGTGNTVVNGSGNGGGQDPVLASLGVVTANPMFRFSVTNPSSGGGSIGVYNNDFVKGTKGSGVYMGPSALSGSIYSQLQAFTDGNTAGANLAINPFGGKVGINLSNPSAALDVSGDIKTSQRLCIGKTCLTESQLQSLLQKLNQ